MAFSRYRKTIPQVIKVTSSDDDHYDHLDKRGISQVTAYKTPRLNRMRNQYNLVKHNWEPGDKFWKLSAKYYGDPGYWHIIAQFNYKPTEAHVTMGETVFVPLPLDAALSELRY